MKTTKPKVVTMPHTLLRGFTLYAFIEKDAPRDVKEVIAAEDARSARRAFLAQFKKDEDREMMREFLDEGLIVMKALPKVVKYAFNV